MTEMHPMLRRFIGEDGVELDAVLDPEARAVMADRDQLEQVLVTAFCGVPARC